MSKTLRDMANEETELGVHCNCDLDNWEPEKSTGHSWVCRIHKMALEKYRMQEQKESRDGTD